jgi:DNA repair protein RadC
MDVSEQQLVTIKGIGLGKARQITAMLKLAKALTIPAHDPFIIRSPKDVFDLLEPDFRYQTKEHFTYDKLLFQSLFSLLLKIHI